MCPQPRVPKWKFLRHIPHDGTNPRTGAGDDAAAVPITGDPEAVNTQLKIDDLIYSDRLGEDGTDAAG